MATDTLSLDKIRYALSKQIPSIVLDTVIHTNYGEIYLDRISAQLVAEVLRLHFEALLSVDD